MSITYLQRIGATVRELTPDDIDAVMQIEESAFDPPRSRRDTIRTLRDISTEALVLQRSSAVLGYVIFEEKPRHLLINRIAVSYPLCGFGGTLVSDVKRRCVTSGRLYVDAFVDERDFTAQKFFSRIGFKAIDIVRGDGDKYLFRHIRGGR